MKGDQTQLFELVFEFWRADFCLADFLRVKVETTCAINWFGTFSPTQWSWESNVSWNIFLYCLSAWLIWNKLQIDSSPFNRKIEKTYFLNLQLNHLKTYLYFSLHLPKKWFTLYLKARDYPLTQSNSTFVSVKLTSSDISERLSVAP